MSCKISRNSEVETISKMRVIVSNGGAQRPLPAYGSTQLTMTAL